MISSSLVTKQVVIRHNNAHPSLKNCDLIFIILSYVLWWLRKIKFILIKFLSVHYFTSFQLSCSFFSIDGKATHSGWMQSMSCSIRILLPEFFALCISVRVLCESAMFIALYISLILFIALVKCVLDSGYWIPTCKHQYMWGSSPVSITYSNARTALQPHVNKGTQFSVPKNASLNIHRRNANTERERVIPMVSRRESEDTTPVRTVIDNSVWIWRMPNTHVE